MMIETGILSPEMERQYNNRAAVPDHLEILRNWERRSAQTRDSIPCVLNLAYGSGPREKLDLFPASDSGKPLLVFVHGGYWQALDKSTFSFVAQTLASAGVNVAVVGYELCPVVKIDDIVDQIRSACIWLYRNGPSFGADANCMSLVGHSAGGHLAAMCLTENWPARDASVPENLVKSLLSISGLFDLSRLIQTSVNNALGLDEAAARRNSPALLSPTFQASVYLVVGGDESDEYKRQGQILKAAWVAAGLRVDTEILPGLNHFTVIEGLADPQSRLFKLALATTS